MFIFRNKPVSILFIAGLFAMAFSAPALAAISYAGSWHAYFDGNLTGTCQIKVTPTGAMSGHCKGKYMAPFLVRGKMVGDKVRFSDDSTGGVFSGVMVSGVHGIGHWQNGQASGDWYIRKN